MTTVQEAIEMVREMEKRPDLVNIQYVKSKYGACGSLMNITELNLYIYEDATDESNIGRIVKAYEFFQEAIKTPPLPENPSLYQLLTQKQ